MLKHSLYRLLTNAHKTYSCIEMLPRHQITSNLDTQIKNWKSQIADVCLALILESDKHQITSDLDTEIINWKAQIPDVCPALILEPIQPLQSYSFDTPYSDYCIDLRATSHILPRRLKGQPQEIDETTRRKRSLHEAEIQNGNIICYRATEDGKLVAFESRSRSAVAQGLEALSFVLELHYFNFPKLTQQMTLNYDIKYCAHPECGKIVETEGDHLQLCQDHSAKLMDNIERKWLSAPSKDIYYAIKNVGERDSEGIHHRIYYQLLPQLNTWIEQIDRIIPTDCTGTGTQTSSVDAWLVLQLRPMRLLLTLMKSAIFLYRMHLNPMADIIAAIVALVVDALKSLEAIKATVDSFVRIIGAVCGVFTAIFVRLGIGILYTLDLIFSDDAYIAIILKTAGGVLGITGAAIAVIAATPVTVMGGICVATVGLTSYLIGNRMREERDRRGVPHTHLIEVHFDLRLARERL